MFIFEGGTTDPREDPLLDATHTVSWAVFQEVIYPLLRVGGINQRGLESLRTRLRQPEWAGARNWIINQQKMLLDEVCRALAATHGDHADAMLDYFRDCGDVLPDAPEMLSS